MTLNGIHTLGASSSCIVMLLSKLFLNIPRTQPRLALLARLAASSRKRNGRTWNQLGFRVQGFRGLGLRVWGLG